MAENQRQPWLLQSGYIPCLDIDISTFTYSSTVPTKLIVASPLDSKHKQSLYPGHIVVRDPPRERLVDDYPLLLARCTGKSVFDPLITSPSVDVLRAPLEYLETNQCSTSETNKSISEMTKKRRSLQSIFVPSFFQSPLTSPVSLSPLSPTFSSSATSGYASRMRSYSSTEPSNSYFASVQVIQSEPSSAIPSPPNSAPLDFLLDDDPFANLTGAPSYSGDKRASFTLPNDPLPPSPRSPLTPPSPEPTKIILASPPPTPKPSLSRAASSARIQPRPNSQKRAFASRPSLPSLHTLARMNVVLPKKVRKGRVGAGLPFEPWDTLDNESNSGNSSKELPSLPPPVTPDALVTASSDTDVSSQADTALNSTTEVICEPTSNIFTGSSDFLADLDGDPLDFTYYDPYFGNEDDDAYPMNGCFEHDNQPDLPYTTDTDVSIDELSMPALSRTTSSDISSVYPSRSLSSTSRSSSGSSGLGELTRTQPRSIYEIVSPRHMSIAENEDGLVSPPGNLISFPSHYLADVVLDWRDRHSIGAEVDFVESPRSSLTSDVNILTVPDIEPGTSAETIRPSMPAVRTNSMPSVENLQNLQEPTDSSGWGGRQGEWRGHNPSQGYSYSGSGKRSGGSSGGGSFFGGGSNGHGRDEDDRRDNDRHIHKSSFSTPSSSDSSGDESAVDEHAPSSKRGPHASTSVSDDDDVPLAQRIPTALTAQRTIRKQVREERDLRRKDTAARADARSRQITLRPAGAAGPLTSTNMTSSQDAALHASQPRQRTKSLANSPAPFAPEDLAKKLQNIQIADVSARHYQSGSLSKSPMDAHEFSRMTSRRDGSGQYGSPIPPLNMDPAPEGARSLRPMRSFHRVERRPVEDHNAVPLPSDAEQKLGRSLTRARSRTQGESLDSRNWPVPPTPKMSLSEGPPPPVPRKSDEHRRLMKPLPEPKSRTSTDNERTIRGNVPRTPVDSQVRKSPVTQQRIFVGDMQRFNMVEIGPTTTAGEVIELIDAQGSLTGWPGTGGWMVFEVAQDFGMERPIRSFELLEDIQSSWNKDQLVNTFVVKLTPLAIPLSRSAMPTSSPTYSGYVEWEVKRGKWSKRWMQLREHGIWLSKRDKGKDEVLLCSLSNFDAYHVTRSRRSPKPFVFSVKSTDKLSFFEDTADYLHVFSCGEKEGKIWMEKILVARSYVLYQERNVLFNPKTGTGNSGGSSALSRSATRNQSISHRSPQPLVTVPPPYTTTSHGQEVFEPGSLLYGKP